MDALGFVEFLYDGLDGYVYGATKGPDLRPDGRHDFKQKFFAWPSEKDNLVEWITSSTKESEVYISPSVMGKRNATKAAFKEANVVWVEFDGNAPAMDNGYDNKPTLKVVSSSGNHQHVYWKLDEPIRDFQQLEAINHNLAISLGADISGWECVQLLRPIGSINHGLGKDRKAMPVTLLEKRDYTHSANDFDIVIDLPSETEAESEFIAGSIDITDLVLRYPWTDTGIRLFKETHPADRSNALMSLAYEVAEMGMSEAEVFAIIQHADDRWGKFKNREDGNKRLAQIVRIARQKYPLQENAAFNGEYPMAFGYRAFLDADIQVEWVVPGMILKDSYNLLTGPSGVGKTQLTMRWAIALALGKPFLGFDVPNPMKVMVLSLEMGHASLKVFAEHMDKSLTEEEKDLLEKNLIILPYGEPWFLDKEEGQRALNQMIEVFQPEGLFVDSIGSATSGSISQEEPVKALMAYNDHIRKKYGMFTWFIHHMRKASGENKNPNAQDDVYGNQYLVNRADAVQSVFKSNDGKNVLTIKQQKMRLSELPPPFKIMRTEHLDFERVKEVVIEPVALVYKQDSYGEAKPPTNPLGLSL